MKSDPAVALDALIGHLICSSASVCSRNFPSKAEAVTLVKPIILSSTAQQPSEPQLRRLPYPESIRMSVSGCVMEAAACSQFPQPVVSQKEQVPKLACFK